MASSFNTRGMAAEPAPAAEALHLADMPAGVPACAAQILRCPLTHGRLRACAPEELLHLNARIADGRLRHADGSRVERPLTAALVVSSGQHAYRVDDGVINLIADCAIALADVPAAPRATLHEDTRRAQRFYDEWGWTRTDADTFVDAAEWEDLRPVSAEYRTRCHRRVRRFLPSSGRFLVDVGCGPIQYPEYREYSAGYNYRVCVDVSYRALQEARRKLGARGLYVLGDVTNLPLQDGCADAVTCLHVLYHVPQERQAAGLRELARVLRTGGQGVVVYSWGPHALLMKLLLVGLSLPRPVRKWWAWRRAQLRRLLGLRPRATPSAPKLPLYFHPHPWAWWRRQEVGCQIEVRSWRSLNVPGLQKYVRPRCGGTALLRLVYGLEERWPHLLGRIGAYPLFILRK